MTWTPAPWQKAILSGHDPFHPGATAPEILYPENVRTPTSDLEGLARPAAQKAGLSAAQKAYADKLRYGELLQAQAPLGAAFSGLATGEIAPGFGVHGEEEDKGAKIAKKMMEGGIVASALDILNPIHDIASGITDIEELLGMNAGDFTQGEHGRVVKRWTANGAQFQMNQDGTITVKKRNGILKTYKPYKPMVFGKKLKAGMFIRLAKKYEKTYKELDKIFKHKALRRKR